MDIDVLALIAERVLPMVPALIFLGFVIKQIPGVPNWTIPIALLVPGVVGAMALYGWTIEGALQGILATGMAVYGNQVWKQVMYKEGDDTTE